MNQLTEKMVILIQKHINSDSFWQNSIQNVIQEMFGTNLIQNTIQYQNFPANSIQNIIQYPKIQKLDSKFEIWLI